MHADVTVCAVLISRISHIVSCRKPGIAGSRAPEITDTVVAFEAKGENNRSAEKARISRAVREVAHFAAFHTDRRMFEHKWAAFIGMALQAGLFILECLVDKSGAAGHSPRGCKGAVWVVAITARHESFIDAMFKRHGKIGTDIAMAAVAELRLGFR